MVKPVSLFLLLQVVVYGQEVARYQVDEGLAMAPFHYGMADAASAVDWSDQNKHDWVVAPVQPDRPDALIDYQLLAAAARTHWSMFGPQTVPDDVERLTLVMVGPQILDQIRFPSLDLSVGCTFTDAEGRLYEVEPQVVASYRDLVRSVKRKKADLWVLPNVLTAAVSADLGVELDRKTVHYGWFAAPSVSLNARLAFLRRLILAYDRCHEDAFSAFLGKRVQAFGVLSKKERNRCVTTLLTDGTYPALARWWDDVPLPAWAVMDQKLYARSLKQLPSAQKNMTFKRVP